MDDKNYNEEVVRQRVMGLVLERAQPAKSAKRRNSLARFSPVVVAASVAGFLGLTAGAAFIDVADDKMVIVRIGTGQSGPARGEARPVKSVDIGEQIKAALKPA